MTFRGRNKVTGLWAYGDLYQNNDQVYIMEHNGHISEVLHHTVGQSTGLKDERGDDIYVEIFPNIEPDIEYHEGELIIYQNGSRFEIGRIKRITESGAFVYYSSGDTAAKTPFDCMRKLTNAYVIKNTSLGGYIEKE